jgi:hypothetical protein
MKGMENQALAQTSMCCPSHQPKTVDPSSRNVNCDCVFASISSEFPCQQRRRLELADEPTTFELK